MFENIGNGRCFIIAEIGGNFTTYEDAVALIDAARNSGADCVKIQTYRAETITSKKAFFDMESTGRILQYDYFKKYELSKELHARIISYIESLDFPWFSTPSHRTDLELLIKLGMKAVKVGADDANNIPFLKDIATTGLPVVLSTGMCTMDEVREAVDAITGEGNRKIIILHTVSGYPTYPEDVNLSVINTFRREFSDFPIGFSDHTLTPVACIAAAAMGADVLERHFTLNKNAEGPDHIISSTPDELAYIVRSVREIEKMRGNGVKEPRGPEMQNRLNNRKSVVAIKAVAKGAIIGRDCVDIKRPGYGIEPKNLELVIGRTAARDISAEDVLKWEDIG